MEDSFDSDLYRAILSQNKPEDEYKSAETQRKCAFLSYNAACKSLDNASTCALLSDKLDNYNKTVYKDGKNIYNNLLLQLHPDIQVKRQFGVPKELPPLNLSNYFKTLGCSLGADSNPLCVVSEKISQSELNQFCGLFEQMKDKSGKGRQHINLESRFQNLDKLQGINQNLDANLINTTDRAANEPKESISKNREVVPSFTTAREELDNQVFTLKNTYSDENVGNENKKKLGTRRGVRNKFISPILANKQSGESIEVGAKPQTDERLKNIEPKMIELIKAEIMDKAPVIGWDDIAGLEFAKSAIQEAVVWPLLRPDIFTGLRRPPKGILLFGPPGTGKTLIGKCVASQSKSTFFSISASSLTSKWIGEGEKMVRALFEVARVHQPAVIFIDEIDSLLTQRRDTEHESSRRIKTEFLVQLDGATTDSEERLLVIGATNRPQELDEAARRRFVKRLYIPLPDNQGRIDLFKKLMLKEQHLLSEEDFLKLGSLANGYSGADIKTLCSEAALEPIRSIDFRNIENIVASQVRPLEMLDFEISLKRVRPSVSQGDLIHYLQWDRTYGSGINC